MKYIYIYFLICVVFGGMDISSMMSNINPEMLKDLTPEKIHDALKNLPPHMKEMMQSMGTWRQLTTFFTPKNAVCFKLDKGMKIFIKKAKENWTKL